MEPLSPSIRLSVTLDYFKRYKSVYLAMTSSDGNYKVEGVIVLTLTYNLWLDPSREIAVKYELE